jgi:hypothetical protein
MSTSVSITTDPQRMRCELARDVEGLRDTATHDAEVAQRRPDIRTSLTGPMFREHRLSIMA